MAAVEERDVVVLGSGPAGLTAALYSARANLKPLVLKGIDAGGQLMLTTEVENYPGFPDAILGPELMEKMEKQAARFEAEMLHQEATRVDLSAPPFGVWSGDEEWRTRTLIVATGASAKMLGLESERRLLGRGVSTCATCDGFFFRGKELLVVGGGDSALEEALFLTRFATKVTIIHRRDSLRASKIMQDRAFANDKIEFAWNSVVEEVLGDGAVTGARITDTTDGASSELEAAGLFVAIGHTPNTALFEDQLEMSQGYIVVGEPTTHTSVDGVFAAGDVVDFVYRQAITAAGMGCQAAMDAERFLEAQGH
jgi:thioredoxin reductase (NADPH)